MDAMDAIFCRRSIRKYTQQPIAEALVTELLQAAMAAPSAGNEQPWHFVVITQRELLKKIPTFHPYAAACEEAPLGILVSMDEHLEKIETLWVQDLAASTENLLIAACALGLGAVWLAVYPYEDRISSFRSLLGLPEHVVPFSLVAVGHPAEQKPRAERYDPARMHLNHW